LFLELADTGGVVAAARVGGAGGRGAVLGAATGGCAVVLVVGRFAPTLQSECRGLLRALAGRSATTAGT
jgi:hypothetical protein